MHIDHITIRTEKLEGSIDFYEENAGLKIVRDLRKIDAQIVFLADTDGDTRIELIEVPAGRGYCGSGISIGFHTNDAAGLREKLLKEGFQASEIVSPNPSVRFFFVSDPNGVQIQFVEQ